MVFVGAAILPHGALPFDGNPDSESEACRERHKKLPADLASKFSNLYNGMQAAGKKVAEMKPDVIILHTPHNIKLTSSVGVHINNTASGTALWKGEWDEFKVNLRLASDVAYKVIDQLRADNIPVEGISSFSGMDTPLRWGEVVPAWCIVNQGIDACKDVKFVVVSQWLESVTVPDPVLAVGRSLSRCVDGLTERVALVVSGDLSHAYMSHHPDPLYTPMPDFPVKPANSLACEQERAFVEWVNAEQDNLWSPERALPWIQKAAELQPVTYSCGMFGFIMLHAFLEGQAKRGVKLSPSVTCCEAPTYYGMMAAVFNVIS